LEDKISLKRLFASAVLVVAFACFSSPFFVCEGSCSTSALGKHICVNIVCEQTEAPIPGLPVELYLPGSEEPLFTGTTNAEGWVSFGSGMPDGTYWIVYNYAGIQHREIVEIDCRLITWKFGYTVDNPTVTKRFVYDLEWWNPAYPPKSGLEVTVTDQSGASFALVTDENGEISWSGNIGYTYSLEWPYGGVTHTETIGPIGLPQSPEDLSILVVNYLEPKSAEFNKLFG
jgi:hypothetical protein